MLYRPSLVVALLSPRFHITSRRVAFCTTTTSCTFLHRIHPFPPPPPCTVTTPHPLPRLLTRSRASPCSSSRTVSILYYICKKKYRTHARFLRIPSSSFVCYHPSGVGVKCSSRWHNVCIPIIVFKTRNEPINLFCGFLSLYLQYAVRAIVIDDNTGVASAKWFFFLKRFCPAQHGPMFFEDSLNAEKKKKAVYLAMLYRYKKKKKSAVGLLLFVGYCFISSTLRFRCV